MSAFKQGGWSITLTLLIAYVLSILPLPATVAMFQPEWVLIVLIYWAIALPHRIGIGIAWFSGLLLDVIRDSLLGQYALTMALVIFIVSKIYQRLRNFPIWQQSVSIFLLILFHTGLAAWIKALSGAPVTIWMIFLPALISALVWPAAYFVLRMIRRNYRVT